MDVRDGDVVKGTVDGQLLGGADIVPGNLLMWSWILLVLNSVVLIWFHGFTFQCVVFWVLENDFYQLNVLEILF